MDTLQAWFGKPYSGTANFRPDQNLGYSATYRAYGSTLQLSTIMPCPIDLLSYWNARTTMTLSVDHGTSQYVAPGEMVKMC